MSPDASRLPRIVTLHHLLGINVGHPEDVLSETTKENIKSRLTNLLCLMIDERSMLSSKILAIAERNVRECAFKGQNNKEIWGRVPVVLLSGDDYQLFPVIDKGAIQGYSRMNDKSPQPPTTRMTSSQLICQRGNYLFTHIMSETVFTFDINYRVRCKNSAISLVVYKSENQHVKMQKPFQTYTFHITMTTSQTF